MSLAAETRAEEAAHTRIARALVAPIDIASLAFFRIVFGFVIGMQGAGYIFGNYAGRFENSAVFFTYWPFDFVKPFPRPGLLAVFALMWLSGIFVSVGLYYRLSAVGMFLSLTYVFLLDMSNYLNHEYLVSLLAFLLIFMPANRKWSADARLRPSIESEVAPAWTVWLLRFQIGLVYFFAGIAKMNADWLRGTWFRELVANNRDFPVIGRFFTNDGFVDLLIYGALVLDLTVAFFLLSRKTRIFAYAAALAFHLMNVRLFRIGIFPWTMMVGTTIFFSPEWPRRMLDDLRARGHPRRLSAFVVGAVVVGALAVILPRTFNVVHPILGALVGGVTGYFLVERFSPGGGDADVATADPAGVPSSRRAGRVLVGGLAAWVVFQLVMPLRHFVIPGDVHWTEEGQRFAWHMLLDQRTGTLTYRVTLPEQGRTVTVDPRQYLQSHQATKLAYEPDMIVQFAHFLRDEAKDQGIRDPEVRADSFASLNQRPPSRFIDPSVDLADVRRPWFGHADWILPEP